jgi:hypothetical protein
MIDEMRALRAESMLLYREMEAREFLVRRGYSVTPPKPVTTIDLDALRAQIDELKEQIK